MGDDKDLGKTALQDAFRDWVWQMSSAGVVAEKIVEEINIRFGKGRKIADIEFVLKIIAMENETLKQSPDVIYQSFPPLFKSIEVLRVELKKAYQIFLSLPNDNGRTGASAALEAVCDFIEQFEAMREDQLVFPLRELMVALADLDRPAIHPMLTPAKVQNRPRMSEGWETMASLAVASMETAMIEGMTRRQASQSVSRELHRREYRQPSGNPITPTTVATWRDRAAKGPGGTYDALHARLQTIRRFRSAGMSFIPGGWKRLLDGLDELDRMKGIRKKPPA